MYKIIVVLPLLIMLLIPNIGFSECDPTGVMGKLADQTYAGMTYSTETYTIDNGCNYCTCTRYYKYENDIKYVLEPETCKCTLVNCPQWIPENDKKYKIKY